MIGYPDSIVVQGTLKSIATHSLSHQIFSALELKERYPVLSPPSPDIIGVFETEAGYLIPEACITAHCAVAEAHGALLHYHESLLTWKSNEEQSDLVEITTTTGRYLTKKLVLTVGAWAPELYGSAINLQLRTERRVLYWFRPSNPNDFELFKVFLHVSTSSPCLVSPDPPSVHLGHRTQPRYFLWFSHAKWSSIGRCQGCCSYHRRKHLLPGDNQSNRFSRRDPSHPITALVLPSLPWLWRVGRNCHLLIHTDAR
jgi:hypothetical protein